MVGTFDDIGEVAWDHSVLEFDEAHKRGLAVLQRFFAIGVEWPRLVPLIKRLMKVPDNPLFLLLNKAGRAGPSRTGSIRSSLACGRW